MFGVATVRNKRVTATEHSTWRGVVVQVDFMAPWCGKCRMLAPQVEALQAAHPGITFYKFDTSKDGLDSLARDIGVSALPVFKFFKNGKEAVPDVVGYKKKPLQDAVEKVAAM